MKREGGEKNMVSVSSYLSYSIAYFLMHGIDSRYMCVNLAQANTR